MRANQTPKRQALGVVRLEDRCTPVQFGAPWADPQHLSLSFAPDGTPAVGSPSSLFASLDARMSRAVWQGTILRAVQAWSEVAGVNVGVTADGGQAFGSTGPAQADPRFGDIRVGALPMAFELAEATPPDPTLAGTLAGDVYLNSIAAFTPESLYRVALHEVGHALGLGPSTDPASVMFNSLSPATSLAPSDIAAIRGLYGSRPPDQHEGSDGNAILKNATRIKFSSSFDGSTPLVIFGDVTTRADIDVFSVSVLDSYTGPMTVRLQTAGVSLLTPKLTITNRNGTVLGTATSDSTQGGVINLTVPRVIGGDKYFMRVEAAPGATFGVGRFGLAVTFDKLNRIGPAVTDAVLRGPYDDVSTQDLISLFKNPNGTTFNDDASTNDTAAFATHLSSAPGFAPNTRFRTTASIASANDVDFYRVKAPSTTNGAPVVLTATVRAVAPNGAVQRIELFNSTGVPINATILANGNGTFTVQAAGLTANTNYYVRVGSGLPGNYQLDIGFGSKATNLDTFTAGSVPASGRVAAPLYLGQTQVFAFTFAVTGLAGTPVRFAITNSAGQEVFALNGLAGDTVSGVTPMLAPGEYRLTLSTASISPVGFSLRGGVITDPIGPQLGDSATTPQYLDPNTGGYTYPNGTNTLMSYLFWVWSVI